MKHIYWKVVAMLLVIAVLGVGVTMLAAPKNEAVVPQGDTASKELRIAATFYPVYITVLNLTQDVDGVAVDCLVTSQVGCLHDYQMSPLDRKLLDAADIVVMNGAGAEASLAGALQEATCETIDLSQGLPLLAAAHDHGHEHDHEEDAVNSHVWMSPKLYRQQVETLCDNLCELDPSRASQYRANAQRYGSEIDAVGERLKKAFALYGDMHKVLFHDTLAYLSEDAGFFSVMMNIGENQTADPDTLAHATDRLAGAQKALFLYDSQYKTAPYEELRMIPEEAVVLSVDTCVMGDVRPDRWLEAMTTLCEDLEAAA